MPTRSHPLVWALPWALAAFATGCGGTFIEPNPPELERVEWKHTAKGEDRPLVYGVLFDLHLADPSRCEAVKARLRADLHAVMAAAVPSVVEVDPFDVTQGTCQQGLYRSFDAYAVQRTAITATELFPAKTVRPVFVYVNNVDALPPYVGYSVRSLRNPANEFAGTALLWGLTMPAVRTALNLDRFIPWTYADDPELFAGVTAAAQADLPLKAVAAEQVMLFDVQAIQRFEYVKSCGALPAGVSPLNFTPDGYAAEVDLGAVPAIQLNGNGLPTPKSTFVAPEYTLTVEVCTANCDRYLRYAGEYRAWLRQRGCHPLSRVAL